MSYICLQKFLKTPNHVKRRSPKFQLHSVLNHGPSNVGCHTQFSNCKLEIWARSVFGMSNTFPSVDIERWKWSVTPLQTQSIQIWSYLNYALCLFSYNPLKPKSKWLLNHFVSMKKKLIATHPVHRSLHILNLKIIIFLWLSHLAWNDPIRSGWHRKNMTAGNRCRHHVAKVKANRKEYSDLILERNYIKNF